MERLTEGCRRSPPLYGPSAELYCVDVHFWDVLYDGYGVIDLPARDTLC
jgi:hypothetical protein